MEIDALISTLQTLKDKWGANGEVVIRTVQGEENVDYYKVVRSGVVNSKPVLFVQQQSDPFAE